MKRILSPTRGQIIIPVIVLLLILAILIPAIVNWTQNESTGSTKGLKDTKAMQMAEAGIDLGFQELIQSSTTWNGILAGTIPSGFRFDTVYSDIGSGTYGTYAVRISSGPGAQQATITSVGRDRTQGEIRAIQAIYQNSVSQTALYVMNGSTVTNQVQVEWGPILSYAPYVTDALSNHLYPRLFSNQSILPFDSNGALVPNTDNVQWWSYDTAIPPAPQIDVKAYSAIAWAMAGGTPPFYNSVGGTLNLAAPVLPGTYYFDGDTTLSVAAGGYLQGDFIVDGSLTINLVVPAIGSVAPSIPSTAWREYGNNWAQYQSEDPGAPATFPGQSGTYSPGATMGINNIAIHGFVYVKNQLIIGGSVVGPVNFLGAMYVGQSSLLNSSNTRVTVYFDPTVADTVKTINVSLAQISWQNLNTCGWSAATPTCP